MEFFEDTPSAEEKIILGREKKKSFIKSITDNDALKTFIDLLNRDQFVHLLFYRKKYFYLYSRKVVLSLYEEELYFGKVKNLKFKKLSKKIKRIQSEIHEKETISEVRYIRK